MADAQEICSEGTLSVVASGLASVTVPQVVSFMGLRVGGPGGWRGHLFQWLCSYQRVTLGSTITCGNVGVTCVA